MALYRDEGIVLRTYKLGEADRIVVMLTRGHGKVRAVAKGVRKTSSRFGARLEPPHHLQVLFYEGRELDVVTQVDTVDHFRAVRDDLDRLTQAVPMLEAADQLAMEREPNAALFQLLLGALRALAQSGSALVVPAFFLKLLALEGFRPVVDECVECGTTEELVAYDVDGGGIHCTRHRRGVPISAGALALVQDVLGGRLGQALQAEPSPVTVEVGHLATRALEHLLERHLRSISVLDRR
ncbi:MAG: DNA repair protein RecO [Acidimicrobiia bacterium]